MMERESEQRSEEVASQHEEQQEAQYEPEAGASLQEEPLYEFPPDLPPAEGEPLAAGPSGNSAADVPANMPIEEAVQRGWVYPPPPSYYQNMAISAERPPLPLAHPTGREGVSPYPYRAGTQALPRPYASPTQGMPPQPVQKESRKWVWVVVAFLSAVLLVSCGLCGWAFYSIANTSFQTTTGVLGLANSYYSAIKTQNYGAAYQDLAPQGSINGLSEQDFIQQAQQRDRQFGQVTSYSVGQPSFTTNPTTGPDLTHMTIVVNVQRTNLSYVVVLTLSKVGGSWKITDFDRI